MKAFFKEFLNGIYECIPLRFRKPTERELEVQRKKEEEERIEREHDKQRAKWMAEWHLKQKCRSVDEYLREQARRAPANTLLKEYCRGCDKWHCLTTGPLHEPETDEQRVLKKLEAFLDAEEKKRRGY